MAINLNTTIDPVGFMRWWLEELTDLLPSHIKQFLRRQKRSPLLMRLDNFQVFLFCYENGQEKPLAQFLLHKEGAKALQDFFQQQPAWESAERVLLLNQRQALRRHLMLPAAALENLDQVLTYEIDRYVPFHADDLYFSRRVLSKNKESTQVGVEFICVVKDRLHYYHQELLNWGLSVDRMIYDDVATEKPDSSSVTYNLLPSSLRQSHPRGHVIASWFFASCLMLLTFVALALPFWWQSNRLQDLQQQVTLAKKQAEAVESFNLEANNLLEQANKVNALKTRSPSILKILHQLTLLLPKDTWLKSFELVDKKLSLQGSTSSSSAALVDLLETSPLFKETSFTTPATQNTQAGVNLFQLDTHVDVRP